MDITTLQMLELNKLYFYFATKIKFMSKLLTTLLVFMSIGLSAQWELVNGPYHSSNFIGMSFRDIGESNGLIAAISESGYSDCVLISPNNGKSWLQSDGGISDYFSRCVDIKDSIIVVGTIWGGVFVSENYGTSFHQFAAGLPATESVHFVAITENSFVATSSPTLSTGYRMYYLPNGADEWIEAEGFPTGIPSTGVKRLFVDGNRIYAATTTGLYVSLNYGATWQGTGMTNGIGNVLAIDNRIFVSGLTTGDQLKYSSNFGQTWTINTSNFPSPFVKSFAYNDSKVFAISNTNEIYSTQNNGQSWLPTSNGLNCTSLQNIIVYGDTAVVLCSSNGPGYSYNGGSSWSNWTKTYGQHIRSMTISSENLVVASDYKVHSTGNLGDSWTSFNHTYNVVHAMDSIVLGGSNNGLLFSYDNGLTFSGQTVSGLPYPASIVEINSLDSIVMLYLVGSGIFYSENYAQSFEDRTGQLVGEYVNSIAFLDSTVLVGTTGAGLHISHDFGLNWEFSSADIPDSTIQVIHVMEGQLYAGTRHKGLYKSLDAGVSWQEVNVGIAERDTSILAIFNIGCEIYVSSQRSGIFRSTDCGETWTIKNEGLLNRNVNTISSLNGYLFAGTDGASVWRTPISSINTQVDEMLENYEEISIMLFPNPVSQVLTVQSNLNRKGNFSIIDIQGRVMLSEIGDMTVKTFDTSGLSHGVYILRVESDELIITRKFIKD